MSWNYRVCKQRVKVSEEFGPVTVYDIREVYYNKDGSIWGISERPAVVLSDRYEDNSEETEQRCVDEIERSLQLMLSCTKNPVIDLDEVKYEPRK